MSFIEVKRPTESRQAMLDGLSISAHSSLQDAADSLWVGDQLQTGKLVAMNAEKVLKVREDRTLKSILQSNSLLYADGISMVWYLRKNGFRAAKVAGCDLWVALMERAAARDIPVLILGATESINSMTAKKLTREFGAKNLMRRNGYDYDEKAIQECIDSFKPKIVTVALGSPKQEYLIQRLYEHYPSALYMGVGGTYDVYTGSLKRAPQWMLKANIEFLFRLAQQPSRMFRQLHLLKFFWLSFLGKL